MAEMRIGRSESRQQAFVIHSLPMLVFTIGAVLVSSLTIFILSAASGTSYAQQTPNPLGNYADIFPGQPASALNRYVCKLEQLTMQHDQMVLSSCTIFPEDSAVYRIQVNLQEKRITEVTLYARGLQPETLFAYWGNPTQMERSLSATDFNLRWVNPLYRITTLIAQPERLGRLITLSLNGATSLRAEDYRGSYPYSP
jgi:hypothetical protein